MLIVMAKAPASPGPETGVTPMIRAAKANDMVSLRKAIDHGDDPNAMTSYGSSAIGYALDNGNVEVLEELLRSGVDPNKTVHTKRMGSNPPMAFGLYSAKILRILIRYGVSITTSPPQDTELNTVMFYRYSTLNPNWAGHRVSDLELWRKKSEPALRDNEEVISILLAAGACPSLAFGKQNKDMYRALDDKILNLLLAEAEAHPDCGRAESGQ